MANKIKKPVFKRIRESEPKEQGAIDDAKQLVVSRFADPNLENRTREYRLLPDQWKEDRDVTCAALTKCNLSSLILGLTDNLELGDIPDVLQNDKVHPPGNGSK